MLLLFVPPFVFSFHYLSSWSRYNLSPFFSIFHLYVYIHVDLDLISSLFLCFPISFISFIVILFFSLCWSVAAKIYADFCLLCESSATAAATPAACSEAATVAITTTAKAAAAAATQQNRHLAVTKKPPKCRHVGENGDANGGGWRRIAANIRKWRPLTSSVVKKTNSIYRVHLFLVK